MSDIPGLGTHRAFPSMARFRTVSEAYYVVCDPAALQAGEQVTADGRVADERFSRLLFPAAAVAGLFLAVLSAVLEGPSPILFIGFAVLGSIVGLLLGLLLIRVTAGAALRRVRGRVRRVDRRSPRAWDLCRLVEQIASTSAWSRGLVDRDRLIPGLVWRSVVAAMDLVDVEHDVARAAEHESLTGLVEDKRRQLGLTAASLDEIDGRLREVLGAAEMLDLRERDREREAQQAQEESDLRRRLEGVTSPGLRHPDEQSQALAIQAEAEALNELLAESDRISAGLGGLS